jgi:hypothetical protein
MNDHKDDHGYESISLMYEASTELPDELLDILVNDYMNTLLDYDDHKNDLRNLIV